MFETMSYPNISEYDGTYYFIGQGPDIAVYSSKYIDSLAYNEPVIVWRSGETGMSNIWSPEMERIGDKWYIYFEADDGNTDNHQIYVIENDNDNPLKGKWKLHGPILTYEEWNFGIHPSTVLVGDRQYLLWSGWEHRRAETETQCIFIAEMENPWTLKSARTLISSPDYEWERQWINPDGSRSAYPIFVNENPEGFVSPDGKKVMVAYSASGIWTPYTALGLLYADADSDLLDPESWTKMKEPQSPIFLNDSTMTGISNISVLVPHDGSPAQVVFQAHTIMPQGWKVPSIYRKEIGWTAESLPDFRFSF